MVTEFLWKAGVFIMESLNAALMKNVKNSEGNFGGYIANIFKEGKDYLVHVLLSIIIYV